MRWFGLILLGVMTAPVLAEDWRLAGTVMHGEGAALIEVQGRHILVRKGETMPGQARTECRLAEVASKAARLDCPGGARLLTLDGVDRNPQLRDTHLSQLRDTHLSGLVASFSAQDVEGLFEDRQRLVSEMPLDPVVDDTGITGYQLLIVRAGSLALQAGFSPGDIVRSVNGVEAGAGGAFMQVLNNLEETRQILIGYERDGRQLQKLVLLH